MSEWISCTLGDVAECIQTGPFGSQLHQSDYSVTGIPVVMPQDMVNGRIDTADIARVEQHHVDRLKRHKLQEGDIVYSRRGDVGRCAYVEKHQQGWLCGTGCLLVRLDKAKVHPRFIAYYLRLPSQVTWVENNAVGITMLNLNTGILSKAPLRIPRSIDEQKRIADTLESMDAKIKHNIELTQTLEEQAQLVYDYWFMQFDFPDENGRPYRSSGGKMKWCEELKREIPEGWHVDNIYACCDLLNGLACQKYPPHPGKQSMPVIKIREMHEGFNEKSDHVHAAVPAKYIVNNGDILFSWSATLEVMIWCGGQGCLNQHIFKVQPRLESWTYVYMLLKQTVTHFARIAESRKTTMGHITSDHLKETKVLIPHKVVLEAFESAVASLIERIVSTSVQNRVLTEQRDFLLPLLMSGQVTVAD